MGDGPVRSAATVRRARRRAAAASAAIAVVLAGAALPARAASAEASDPGAARPSASRAGLLDAASAQTEAVRTGEPVEVTALTTETERVVANSSGTLTLTQDVLPVRVRHGDTWEPVSATLHRDPAGTVSPAATPSRLRLSGGGAGPLAEMTNGGRQMSISWPGSLPTPTLSGDTATYPEVLPGVDLQVRVTSLGGFSHVLVVKTPQAATNPQLAHLHLPTTVKGVTVTEDGSNNLTAADAAGMPVFTAPAPLMWDSSVSEGQAANARGQGRARDVHGPSDSAEPSDTSGPGVGAKQAAVDAAVDATGLTLTPDRNLLTSPSTRFPLYIDPSWNPNYRTERRQAFAQVHSGYRDTSFYNSVAYGNPGVGYQGYETVTGVERSFFQMYTGHIWLKTVIRATLTVTETYSARWGCETDAIELWTTTPINKYTRWAAQPTRTSHIGTARVPGAKNRGCPGSQPVEYNVTGVMRSVATYKLPTWTFGLYAADESDKIAFRRFSPSPTITVEYNSVPAIATHSVKTSPATSCGTTGNPPYSLVGNTAVTLMAIPVDADGKHVPVDVQFSMVNDRTGKQPFPVRTKAGSNGVVARLTVAAGYFDDNTSYTWSVRAWDGYQYSPWRTCHFTVDKSRPGAPDVSSPDYPDEGDTRTPARTVSTFQFSPQEGARGDDIPVCYISAFDEAPPVVANCQATPTGADKTVAGTGGNASRTLTPTKVGPNTLYVYALDKAGNRSDTAAYDFTTAGLVQPDPDGDLTGDTKPDLVAVGTAAHPGLWMWPGTKDGHLGSGRQLGGAGAGGDSAGKPSDWTGALTTHADFNDDGAQDVLARLHGGALRILLGSGDGTPFDPDPGRSKDIHLPTPDDADAPPQVDQVVAAGDADNDGIAFPDLLVVAGDRLLLYPANPQPWGDYDPPVLLGDSGWANRTIAAATVGGAPALWVRDKTTGELDLYQGAEDAPAGSEVSTKTVVAASGWTASGKPMLAGEDIDVDGEPDLWAVAPANNGTLSAYLANGPGRIGGPLTLGSGWIPWYSSLS